MTEVLHSKGFYKSVAALERKLNAAWDRIEDQDGEADEEYDKVFDQLHRFHPYHDMFHYGCSNFPNCESEGCGA